VVFPSLPLFVILLICDSHFPCSVTSVSFTAIFCTCHSNRKFLSCTASFSRG